MNFFSDKSLSIKDREELLLKLYVTMQEHFGNVKECIELYSQHSIHDSATSMFYSKLSSLERMLGQVGPQERAARHHGHRPTVRDRPCSLARIEYLQISHCVDKSNLYIE